jgi:O-antigen ligase
MNGIAAVGGRAVRPPAPLSPASVAAAGLALGFPVSLALSGALPPMTLELAAGVAFLAFLALALMRFDAAVVLAFALLGFVVVDPAPVDLLLVVLITVAAATGRFKPRVPASVVGALAALVALNLLSAVEVVQAGRAASFLATTTYLVLFAFWLSGYVDSRSRAHLVANGYLFAAAASTVIGLLALFVGFPGADLVVEFGRVRGFFQDPNVFGPFLIPAALILLEELLRPRLLASGRRTITALLLVVVLGILFAYSRAGWLNLAVALVVMLAVHALRPGAGRTVAVAVAALLVTGAVVGGAVVISGSAGFLSERARVQAYDTQRFDAQRSGVELAEHHPLGVGPGQFEVLEPISSHSLYVRVLSEQGVLGLATLILLLGGTLVLAGSNAVAGRDTFGVGSAVLLGLWCGLLANSAFIDTLHWRHLWLVAALIWAGAYATHPVRAQARGERRAD